LVLCVGLACGAGASQGPEFAQQYLQRLGGWVDSYKDRVARLDTRANQFKMTREQYIAALRVSNDPKVRGEADNIATWPIYLAKYQNMQQMLQNGPSWMRPVRLAQSYYDPAFAPVVRETWKDYKPATPTTGEGAVFGGIGFIAGWILVGLSTALLQVPVSMARRVKARVSKPRLVTHRLKE
jgi:hypothetical protein